jgi:hypothetical protein
MLFQVCGKLTVPHDESLKAAVRPGGIAAQKVPAVVDRMSERPPGGGV